VADVNRGWGRYCSKRCKARGACRKGGPACGASYTYPAAFPLTAAESEFADPAEELKAEAARVSAPLSQAELDAYLGPAPTPAELLAYLGLRLRQARLRHVLRAARQQLDGQASASGGTQPK
jgi:hypothetical protein